MSTILILVLVLLILGVIPAWPYSRGWGATPAGLLCAILLVILVLYALGGLPA